MTETELVTEFKEFYRKRQLSSTFETEDSSIRYITANILTDDNYRIKLINELSETQLAVCQRTYLTEGKSKLKNLIDTGTNLKIFSKLTYNSLENKPPL